MSIELPDLPYAYDALEPVISGSTVWIHYDKHHRTYVDKVNTLIRDTTVSSSPLDTIVQWSAQHAAVDRTATAIFNNAAQAWNHAFYWRSLRPQIGRGPGGRLSDLIIAAFGSLDGFYDAYKSAATGHFGSGWAWLVLEQGHLKIVTTSNADTPIVHGQTPLLVIDIWEHAYYLDYQERRAAYVAGVVDRLLDWEFAEHNLALATAARASAADILPATAAAAP